MPSSSSLTLRSYEGTDPFLDHPALTRIWPDPINALFQEGLRDTFHEATEEYPFFLIEYQNQVIGVTGAFSVEGSSDLYLRWHGILPEYQHQGLSTQSLSLLVAYLQDIHGEFLLVESIPYYPGYHESLEQYFSSLGFQPEGSPEYCSWSHLNWQSWIVSSSHFLQPPQPSRQTLKT